MELSPTSRNSMKIGAALILIALLLVCGPISDRMGGRESAGKAPSVAAGPPVVPVDPSGAVEAVAAGALVGASVAETDAAASGDGKADDDLPVVVAAATAGAAAGAAVAADSGTGGGSVLPPVSAGVPVPATDVASGGLSEAADASAAAAEAFDKLLDSEMASRGGLGPAAGRFPPPVAANGDSGQAFASSVEAFRVGDGELLRPCDSPGSGCQNLSSASAVGGAITPFGSGSPRGPR